MSLGVYIHIPFCAAKCRYCDFNSHISDYSERRLYVSALCDEIRNFKNDDMQVDTIYFGGGTPTVLEPSQLVQILNAVYDTFDVDKTCEITTECNPATIDKNGLEMLRSSGFNRISIGMQSANDDELKFLGRIHSFAECEKCVKDAREAGFENLSVDLMFGLPHQTVETWKTTLRKAVALSPNHISCYGLKIEEGTPFYSMNLDVDEELSRDMYDICDEFLYKNGYGMYEISNFAKSGGESRHNIKYWKCNDYIGFGAGAYSCVNGVRFSNVRDTNDYINREVKVIETAEQSEFDKISEYIFLGLRMVDGIDISEFNDRFGKSVYEVFGEQIQKNINRGTMIIRNDRLIIPKKYLYVSNAILVDFV